MRPDVFEVVLDHQDPNHHGQMERLARELRAWAQRHGATALVREERQLRPGVFQLRFSVDRHAARVKRFSQDCLALSRRA